MMSQTNGPAAIITTSLTHRPFIIRAARIMAFYHLEFMAALSSESQRREEEIFGRQSTFKLRLNFLD